MLLTVSTCHDDVLEARVAGVGVTRSLLSPSSIGYSRSELRFCILLLLGQLVAKELPQTHCLGDRHRNSEPRIAIGGGPRVGRAAELKPKTAAGVSCYNGLPLCRNGNVAHSRSVRPVRL
jgi:hypothetical protein